MDHVHRLATALLATHNPRWRSSPVLTGETDWVGTALRRATSFDRDYIVRASKTGLDDAERDALLGWVTWIRRIHAEHFARFKLAPPPLPPWSYGSSRHDPSLLELRRWAHVARRSRWPLLRNVVSESLRCVFEVDVVDQLPLPVKHEDLFELVCLVRVLNALEPQQAALRWLDADAENAVRIGDVSARYQESLDIEATLRAGFYPADVVAAMAAHQLNPPRRLDLLLTFDKPRAGFSGILIECKSGDQTAENTIYQLLVYRSSLRRRLGRLLVWGIIETPRAAAMYPASPTSDHWVFSGADQIPAVLAQLGLAYRTDADEDRARVA